MKVKGEGNPEYVTERQLTDAVIRPRARHEVKRQSKKCVC